MTSMAETTSLDVAFSWICIAITIAGICLNVLFLVVAAVQRVEGIDDVLAYMCNISGMKCHNSLQTISKLLQLPTYCCQPAF